LSTSSNALLRSSSCIHNPVTRFACCPNPPQPRRECI
jgi:hypothetical protein